MTPHIHEPKAVYWGFGLLAAALIGACAYSYIEITSLSGQLASLSANVSSLATNVASTTDALQQAIGSTNLTLSNALSIQAQNVGQIQAQLGGVQNQVGGLTGTLSTLQKLAQTDPQLLEKYSKVFFLSDNYVPARLSEIPSQYEYSDKKQLVFQSDALPHLEGMINDAAAAGVKFYAFSAYRSFAEQKALKGDYTVTYGAGTANSFSADQGYSEHQLGTATDLIAPGQGGVLDGFDKTPAFPWLQANAYRYGFILSYPKGNGYYVSEPWHWRFVGVRLATDLHNMNKNFYDLDQRTIDGYLANIFD